MHHRTKRICFHWHIIDGYAPCRLHSLRPWKAQRWSLLHILWRRLQLNTMPCVCYLGDMMKTHSLSTCVDNCKSHVWLLSSRTSWFRWLCFDFEWLIVNERLGFILSIIWLLQHIAWWLIQWYVFSVATHKQTLSQTNSLHHVFPVELFALFDFTVELFSSFSIVDKACELNKLVMRDVYRLLHLSSMR